MGIILAGGLRSQAGTRPYTTPGLCRITPDGRLGSGYYFFATIPMMGSSIILLKSCSDVRKDTANWIALSDYDIETARHMLATERYLYSFFFVIWR